MTIINSVDKSARACWDDFWTLAWHLALLAHNAIMTYVDAYPNVSRWTLRIDSASCVRRRINNSETLYRQERTITLKPTLCGSWFVSPLLTSMKKRYDYFLLRIKSILIMFKALILVNIFIISGIFLSVPTEKIYISWYYELSICYFV